jgi:hypothetical protein
MSAPTFDPRARGVCPQDHAEVKLLLDTLSKEIWKVTKNALTHQAVKENLGDESFPLVTLTATLTLAPTERTSVNFDLRELEEKCAEIAQDPGLSGLSPLVLPPGCAERLRRKIIDRQIVVKVSGLVAESELGRDANVTWVDGPWW